MLRATSSSLARLCAAAALAGSQAACASIPEGRSAIDAVDGAPTAPPAGLDEQDVTAVVATRATPKFLGLFRGVVYDYEVYDPSVLQRDLARIERYYRGRGFFYAHVRAARVLPVSGTHVKVEITVDEGPASHVREVRVTGTDALPPPIADAARRAADDALPRGARFDEDAYKTARGAVMRALTENGYAYAKVEADAVADLDLQVVDFRFDVRPGAPAVFGPITIVGLPPDMEEGPLRRAIDIHENDPYSSAAIDAATQALLDLEVFASVQITPTLSDPPSPAVPLVVKIEPTKLHVVRFGGGVEFDAIKTELHGLAGWEDHDFLGDLRDFSVNFRPGIVLYPTRATSAGLVTPERVLLEERLRLQLRQPGFLEARTTGFVRPELNVFPLLVESDPSDTSRVVGYVEPKGAVGVERRFGRHVFASVAHNVQGELPFSYKGELDPNLPAVLLSFPQLITSFDFRDDAVHPHAGVYLTNDLQIAGGPFGGSATDVRVQPDVRAYAPLSRSLTFAVRGSFGFLHATNYGSTVQDLGDIDRTGQIGNPALFDRDVEIVYFRGFFSGGPSNNRGFPLRGIAPHGVVPFLNPAAASTQVALHCDPNQVGYDATQCSIPIGGFTLWEASAELRWEVAGPFGVAFFCDAGDVSPKEVDVRFDRLHLACGAGGRYDTPVGPIRLDVGYRIQPMQVLGYRDEAAVRAVDPTEGVQPTLFGAPMAISFGLGEPF